MKSNITIRQRVEIRDEIENKPKRRFFRRKYVDQMTGLVFDNSSDYSENKADFQKAFKLVCTGKCKDMFEAHAAICG